MHNRTENSQTRTCNKGNLLLKLREEVNADNEPCSKCCLFFPTNSKSAADDFEHTQLETSILLAVQLNVILILLELAMDSSKCKAEQVHFKNSTLKE